MSATSGTNIVEDGLVFCVDFANIKTGKPNRFLSLGESGSGASFDNNVTFPIQGTGIFKRLGYNQVYGGYNIQETDVVYKYDLGLTGCHYHGFDIYHNTGTYLTITFDYLIQTSSPSLNNNLIANIENGGTGISWAHAETSFSNGAWKTVTATLGPSTAYGFSRVLLYPGACANTNLASSGYILYKNVRVEISQTLDTRGFLSSTTFNAMDIIGKSTVILVGAPTYSSLNKGALVLDGIDDYITSSFSTTSGQAVTYCGWVYSTETTAIYKNFMDSVSTRPMIWWDTEGKIEFDTGFYRTPTVYRNTWVNVALSKPAGSSAASYYVNGILAGSGSAYTTPALTPTFLNRAGGQTWKGNCSAIHVYNRALSATEIKQNFDALRGRFGV